MDNKTPKKSPAKPKIPARKGEQRDAPGDLIPLIYKDPLYVPPSFRPPYCSYPPYCLEISPTMDKWRTARLRVEVEVSRDNLQTNVEGWVNQLVRGQMGEKLEEIERKYERKLVIKLDPIAVKLIDEAMKALADAG